MFLHCSTKRNIDAAQPNCNEFRYSRFSCILKNMCKMHLYSEPKTGYIEPWANTTVTTAQQLSRSFGRQGAFGELLSLLLGQHNLRTSLFPAGNMVAHALDHSYRLAFCTLTVENVRTHIVLCVDCIRLFFFFPLFLIECCTLERNKNQFLW